MQKIPEGFLLLLPTHLLSSRVGDISMSVDAKESPFERSILNDIELFRIRKNWSTSMTLTGVTVSLVGSSTGGVS